MKIKSLLLMLAGSIALGLTSCDKDPLTDVQNITFQPVSSEQQSIDLNTDVTISFKVSSIRNLDSITAVSIFENDITDLGTVIKYTTETKNDSISFTVNSGNKIGNRIIRFNVVDVENNRANISFSLAVQTDIIDSLDTVYVGRIYNSLSTLPSAWDLVLNASVSTSGSSTNKDIQSANSITNPFNGSWSAGTGNGTQFVLADSLDFVNDSYNNNVTVFENGTPSGSVTSPKKGQVYVAKLRNSDAYAVIRIDEVDAGNSDCNCLTTGRLVFSYKK